MIIGFYFSYGFDGLAESVYLFPSCYRYRDTPAVVGWMSFFFSYHIYLSILHRR